LNIHFVPLSIIDLLADAPFPLAEPALAEKGVTGRRAYNPCERETSQITTGLFRFPSA